MRFRFFWNCSPVRSHHDRFYHTPQASDSIPPTDSPKFAEYWKHELACPLVTCRLSNVDRLVELGSAGIPPLVGCLKDSDKDVRAKAVEALVDAEDDRVLPLLISGLRSEFLGGSSRRQIVICWGITLLGLGAIALRAWTVRYEQDQHYVGWAALAMVFQLVMQFLIPHFTGGRRVRSPIVQAYTEAILRIGERKPTPELAEVLDDLRSAAGDRFLQSKETRESARVTAARIDELTRQIKLLPVASSAPAAAGAADLPRPAGNQTPESALPRPAVARLGGGE